mgnify:CR=1 FL=1
MENLKALTEAVCCVAREAGHFLKEERKSFRREVVQEKLRTIMYLMWTRLPRKRLYLPLGNCFPKPDSLPKKGLLPIVTKRIAG